MAAADLLIRPARHGEKTALTALCLRSKAHWGYDAAFLEASRVALTVAPGAVAAGRVDEAEARAVGVPLGVLALDAGEFELLFVAPEAMGRGIGRALLVRALMRARAEGWPRLRVLSDPQARGYEAAGARLVRMAPSDAIPGRRLPLLDFALQPAPGAAPS